jgi:hypothetical protein
MKKTTLIIICSIFLIGCFTNCFATSENHKLLIETKTGNVEKISNIQKAIHLAKNSYAHSLYCYPHDKQRNTNEIGVPRTIKNIKGPVHIFGWQTYIVTYVYKDLNKNVYHACAFDVNLEAKVTRVIIGKKQFNNYTLWHRIVSSYTGVYLILDKN